MLTSSDWPALASRAANESTATDGMTLERFWIELKAVIDLGTPIEQAITQLQADVPKLGQVLGMWRALVRHAEAWCVNHASTAALIKGECNPGNSGCGVWCGVFAGPLVAVPCDAKHRRRHCTRRMRHGREVCSAACNTTTYHAAPPVAHVCYMREPQAWPAASSGD
jgi:hypothetical protein